MTSTCRAAAALALATLFGACANGAKSAPSGSGGSGNNSTGGSTGNNSGGTNGTTPPKGSCDSPQIDILFSPMYSAYDGVHPFKIPAVVNS
ncbi:MAG TPA: hypothetical protein VN914_15355, partial [Polyangia bacterium]|nr:hypothetical protein [Polyangia bacterium]